MKKDKKTTLKQNKTWEKAWALLLGGVFIGLTPKFEFVAAGIAMILTGLTMMLRASHKMEKEKLENRVVNSTEDAIIEL